MVSEPIIHENFKSELSKMLERTASAFFVVQTQDYQVIHANDAATQLGVEQSRFCYQVNMGEETPCQCEASECWVRAYKNASAADGTLVLSNPYCAQASFGKLTVTPFPSESDQVDKLVFSITSTGEFEKLLSAVENTFNRYRALFNQSQNAIFTLDLQGNHLAVNKRACELLGYSESEIIGLSYREISAEIKDSREKLEKLLAGEPVPYYERRFFTKSGESIIAEVDAELVHHPDGSPWFILSTLHEVSDRPKKEITADGEVWTDPLTGLSNRQNFIRGTEVLLTDSILSELKCYFMLMDIKGFGSINETYGKETGDDLLKMFARRMKHNFRFNDLICRYSADEFMVLLAIDNMYSLQIIVDRLFTDLSHPFVTKKGLIDLSISIGIAEYTPDRPSFEVVSSNAEQALTEAKKQSENSYAIYSA